MAFSQVLMRSRFRRCSVAGAAWLEQPCIEELAEVSALLPELAQDEDPGTLARCIHAANVAMQAQSWPCHHACQFQAAIVVFNLRLQTSQESASRQL